jgi:hypothetical protein
VNALTDAGFKDAGLSLFWNPKLGYLGGYQEIITADKEGESSERKAAATKDVEVDAIIHRVILSMKGFVRALLHLGQRGGKTPC